MTHTYLDRTLPLYDWAGGPLSLASGIGDRLHRARFRRAGIRGQPGAPCHLPAPTRCHLLRLPPGSLGTHFNGCSDRSHLPLSRLGGLFGLQALRMLKLLFLQKSIQTSETKHTPKPERQVSAWAVLAKKRERRTLVRATSFSDAFPLLTPVLLAWPLGAASGSASGQKNGEFSFEGAYEAQTLYLQWSIR